MGKLPEARKVLEVEIVTGVDAQSERVRRVRGLDVTAEAPVPRIASFLERARERFRVQLHPIRVERGGPFRRGGVGFDEETDADAARLEVSQHAIEPGHWCIGRPARLTGDFPWTDRHER